MPTGIDSPVDCSPYADAIKADFDFVGRYYRKTGSKWATLTESEVLALHAVGLQVVALWEAASTDPGYFSYGAGVDDSTSAYRQALMAGQPPGTPIYFAVDFDALPQAVAGAISDYFNGIAKGFELISQGAPAYTAGVYGSGRTCSYLQTHNLVTHTWLAVSTGWAGYNPLGSFNIKQGPPSKNLSFNNDTDTAADDYGGF